jgi:hypothetical protein
MKAVSSRRDRGNNEQGRLPPIIYNLPSIMD